jgi:hypothetical protein
MRRYHLDSKLGQLYIERVSVVGAIADKSFGQLSYESPVEGRGDKPTLMRRS